MYVSFFFGINMRALDSYGSDLILQTVLTDPGGSGSSFPCLCLADGDAFKLFPVKKKTIFCYIVNNYLDITYM